MTTNIKTIRDYEARTEAVKKYISDLMESLDGKSLSNCAIVVLTADEIYSGYATTEEPFTLMGALDDLKQKIREGEILE